MSTALRGKGCATCSNTRRPIESRRQSRMVRVNCGCAFATTGRASIRGRARHWGLTGMRERALRIGGQLNVRSEAGAGTELELLLPGAAAYSATGERRGVLGMLRKRAGRA